MKRRIMFVAMVFLLGMLVVPTTKTKDVGATTKSELEEKKAQKEKENEKLQEKSESLESQVEDLDQKVKESNAKVASLETRLSETKSEVDKTKKDLEKATKSKEEQYKKMKKRIKFLYENGSMSYLEVVLEAKSFQDLLKRATYVSKIAAYDSTMFSKLEKTEEKIKKEEKQLKKQYQEIASVTQEAKEEQQKVETLTTQKNQQLEQNNEKIAENEELLKEYDASIQKLEEEAKTASSSGTTVKGSGQLTWPVPASHNISSSYGYRFHPIYKEKRLHNGIDISVPSGNSIVAADGGTVSLAQYSTTAGNWIIINHGNGLSTVYMHNSSLSVSAGQHVKKGQVIALSGSTGNSTGPHLHFGVMKNGSYVNPMNYF